MAGLNADLFWSRVAKSDACWLWTGPTYKGYGRYSGMGAHRVAYLIVKGAIPVGLELDHLCSRPLCVRPDHLEPVTRAENIRRRSEGVTHCKHGHPFSPENTYRYDGRRFCRACNRAAAARYAERRRAS